MSSGFDFAFLQWFFVAGAGILIGALALVIGQRALLRPGPAKSAGSAEKQKESPAATAAGVDPFHLGSAYEKRQAFRRRGKCVDVDIADQDVEDPPRRGWVVDRSIKGVRLSIDQHLPVGTTINVRVSNMNPPMPWLAARVVNSKENGPHYEIGCEFVTPPTWNIMLMFG